MVPLVAYNYASGDHKRMRAFFSTARIAGLAVSAVCVVLYRIFAPQIVEIFISDADTVRFGQEFLAARCCATPFMFLSFHMVHYMQAIGRGRVSFWLAAIRQLALNIPILFLFNRLFGMTGIVWTQLTADVLNVILSYVIYFRLPAPAGRRRLSR
jgi:Na+-driven multidrug efflux pump